MLSPFLARWEVGVRTRRVFHFHDHVVSLLLGLIFQYFQLAAPLRVFQVKTLLRASDDRRATVLRLVAGRGNIGMWAPVVDVLEEGGLLEEVHIKNRVFSDLFSVSPSGTCFCLTLYASTHPRALIPLGWVVGSHPVSACDDHM